MPWRMCGNKESSKCLLEASLAERVRSDVGERNASVHRPALLLSSGGAAAAAK